MAARGSRIQGTLLLECVLAVLFSALLLAMSSPLLSALRFSGLKQEARNFQHSLEVLKLTAVYREEPIVMTIGSGGYQAAAQSKPQVLLLRKTLSHRLTIPEGQEYPGRKLVFFPSGVVTPKRLELNSGEWRCVLIVSLRGRVKSDC